MKTQLIIPRAAAAEWQWREYKGFIALCGDCVVCEVVNGKAVVIKDAAIIGQRKPVIESESGRAA